LVNPTYNYTINFKEIDTPTEKERAEINEIKARTDATYIDAGILTQDEVRDNIIKNPNSGYNDIEGDIADEDYSDEEQEGNGETQQNPFNLDSDDTEFRTTENGVKFPIKEGETTKESCKEFFEDKEQHEKDMKHSYEAQKEKMTLLAMDYAEFKDVCSQINSLRDTKYKNKKVIRHNTIGFIYVVENNGIDNYLFKNKLLYNEDKRKDWN